MKKFEEGVFSDLRNLKPGVDACLEEPKVRAEFLTFGTALPSAAALEQQSAARDTDLDASHMLGMHPLCCCACLERVV